MKLIIIAAFNKKRVIGKNGKTPWHIPEDLQRFKQITTGYPVLMGGKTFESIEKLLSDRRNIVLTSRTIPGVETYSSIDSALSALRDEEKVFVIGGGEIFRQTISKADELLLTEVENDYDGDTYFPQFGNEFLLKETEKQPGFTYLTYVRQ